MLSYNVTSTSIPSVLLSSPLHPSSLPHMLSEGRWIALLHDINNMSYCWSVKGKACELSIPSHWLHNWDDVHHFFLSFFLSFDLSLFSSFRSLIFCSESKPLPVSLLSLSVPLWNKHLLKETQFASVFWAQKILLSEDQDILWSLISGRVWLINCKGSTQIMSKGYNQLNYMLCKF